MFNRSENKRKGTFGMVANFNRRHLEKSVQGAHQPSNSSINKQKKRRKKQTLRSTFPSKCVAIYLWSTKCSRLKLLQQLSLYLELYRPLRLGTHLLARCERCKVSPLDQFHSAPNSGSCRNHQPLSGCTAWLRWWNFCVTSGCVFCFRPGHSWRTSKTWLQTGPQKLYRTP